MRLRLRRRGREDCLQVPMARGPLRREAPVVKHLLVLAASALAALAFAPAGGAHVGCPGKDVAFRASDATRLVAHRYGAGKTFVVLAHQSGGNLCQWYPYAKRLASLGYSALPFDFRGSGESQTPTGAAARRYDRDVSAAVRLARRLGARKLLVVGASMGGWASITAAPAISPPLAGLVSLSTPPDYLGDARTSAAKLTIPVLYLASKGEGLSEETQSLYDATPSTDKAIRLVSGDAHGVDLLDSMLGKPSWKTVRALIERFLSRH